MCVYHKRFSTIFLLIDGFFLSQLLSLLLIGLRWIGRLLQVSVCDLPLSLFRFLLPLIFWTCYCYDRMSGRYAGRNIWMTQIFKVVKY